MKRELRLPFLYLTKAKIQMKLNQILAISLILAISSFSYVGAYDSTHYKIHQGDVLDVSVWGDETLVKVIRVLPDGSISFPLAGYVMVAGFSPSEVEEKITKKLKKYLPDPEVTVIVNSTDGNKVYILGKVNKPGVIPLQGPMTILQALSISGGFNRFADLGEIKILRGRKVLEVDYDSLIRGKHLELNYPLQADDTILVP